MTDKATVEIPSPVAGKVASLGGEPGQLMAVGSELIRLEIEGDGNVKAAASVTGSDSLPLPGGGRGRGRNSLRQCREAPHPNPPPEGEGEQTKLQPPRATPAPMRTRPQADRIAGGAPPRLGAGHRAAVRAWQRPGRLHRARGPGRLPRVARPAGGGRGAAPARAPWGRGDPGTRLAPQDRAEDAGGQAPHPDFSYVEEIDVTELEALRAQINGRHAATRGKLTLLPLIARAVVLAVEDFPQMNARFDDDAGVVTRHRPVRLGIATQTENGLVVPVLRRGEAQDLWGFARDVARLAEVARSGKASREELGGSTITITSLGALGGLVTTPVINHPEVAIIGVNRIVERPMFQGGAVVPLQLMNLSSSFDHRVVDAWMPARFIQVIRALLEHPAMLFVE